MATVTKARGDLDRSVAFSILLEVYPGYGDMDSSGPDEILDRFLGAWYADPSTNMYEFGERFSKYE